MIGRRIQHARGLVARGQRRPVAARVVGQGDVGPVAVGWQTPMELNHVNLRPQAILRPASPRPGSRGRMFWATR